VIKSLVVSLAALMLVVSTSFAGGNYGNASGSGYANDPDYSFSRSYHGYGNDWSEASANGGGGFSVNAETTGNHFAGADVYGKAKGYADTCTWAYDTGFTSKAGASSEVDGWAYASGSTLAGFTDYRGRGVDSQIWGNTYFAAEVDQSNSVKEVGYSAGGISAGNSSYAGIENGRKFYDGSDWYGANFEDGYTKGFIKTSGRSEVTIDPYGNNRSIAGYTTTNSYADTNHRGDSSSAYMSGQGGIGGDISNQYGSYAGGQASFNYAGTTDRANGGASLNATINKTSYSTTVTVNASSHSSLISSGNRD
ncbi:MAG: hypothetical protein DRO67_08510, partial [Candidatus Asgardarchaeum californiense]